MKTKKRLLAMLTAVFTCVSSISVPLSVSADDAPAVSNVVFEDDFESGTNIWTYTGGTTAFPVENTNSEYGSAVKAITQWNRMGKAFELPTGTTKYKVSFDMDVTRFDLESGWNSLNIMLTDGITNEAKATSASWPVLRVGHYPEKGDLRITAVKVLNDSGNATDGCLDDAKLAEVSHTVTLGEWVRADIVVDVTGSKIETYLNGKLCGTNANQNIAEKFAYDKIKGILLNPTNDGFKDAEMYFDNFSITNITTDDSLSYTTSVDTTKKTVDVKFNQTISQDTALDTSKVTLTKLGADNVNVTKIEKVTGDKIRLTYDGNLDAGREYKLSINGGIKSILNKTVNTILFNAPAGYAETAKVEENFDDEVIGTKKEDESIDTSTFNRNDSSKDHIDESFVDRNNGKALKLSRKSTSTTGNQNMYFRINLSNASLHPEFQKSTGITKISYDYYGNNANPSGESDSYTRDITFTHNNNDKTSVWKNDRVNMLVFSRNGNAYAHYWDASKLAADNELIGAFKTSEWHKVYIEFDYDNNCVRYYLDNLNVKEQSFNRIQYNKLKGAMNSFWFAAYCPSDVYYMLDNIKITHEEFQKTVSSVRFKDASENYVVGDDLDSGVSEIQVKLNGEISEIGTNVTLTKGSQTIDCQTRLSEDKKILTIIPPIEMTSFENDPNYKLTINKAIGITDTVEYRFCLGKTTINSVTAPETTSYTTVVGTPINEISGLPKTLTGNTDNGTVDIPVTWTCDNYNMFTPGDTQYTLTANLEIPKGYTYEETEPITVNVTVGENTAEIKELIDSSKIRKNISERSPITTGGFSQTDSLQMGLESGAMTAKVTGLNNKKYNYVSGNVGEYGFADSVGGEEINGISVSRNGGDAEIEIGFNDKYNGGKALKDLKLVFTNIYDYSGTNRYWQMKTDNSLGWDVQLLYKNSEGKWKIFCEDATDFLTEDGSYKGKDYKDDNGSRGFGFYPTLYLSDLAETLKDVNGLKIRMRANGKEYKLAEVDMNMANDGETVNTKRLEYTSNVRFAKLFADDIVIQRDKAFKVNGYAAPGADVKVTLTKDGAETPTETKTVTTASDGKWVCELNAVNGSTDTYMITAEVVTDGKNKKTISNVVFGDVYLAAGQSNMAMVLSNVSQKLGKSSDDLGVTKDGKGAGDGNVRFFNQQGYRSALWELDEAYSGEWVRDDEWVIINNSAVPYYFAEELYKQIEAKENKKVPVAVYNVPRNGSDIRSWMPENVFTDIYGSNKLTDNNRSNYYDNSVYTGCYNALVAPLKQVNFNGVIWYQGEYNASEYEKYGAWFEKMVAGWRDALGNENLTFSYVQLGGWEKATSFEKFRDAQNRIMFENKDNNINMVTAIDLGMVPGDVTQPGDKKINVSADDAIHYGNKKPVGVRLARNMMKYVYGSETVSGEGPLFKKAEKVDGGIKVTFDNANGLKSQTRKYLANDDTDASFTPSADVKGFEISQNGTEWEKALSVTINSDGSVTIGCEGEYKYVRYAWVKNAFSNNTDDAVISLYNSDNISAYPFAASVGCDTFAEAVINDNKVNVTISRGLLSDMENANISGVLVVAQYDGNNRLVKAEIADDTVAFTYSNQSYTKSFDKAEGAVSAKALYVDNMTNMMPLAIQKVQ